MNKNFLIGSIAVLGLFVALFLITPVFARSGFGRMMGGNYYSQNWGSNGCPMFGGDERGYRNNGWGMMGNWR